MKFAGLGLKNLVISALFTILLIVILKTIFIKYPVKGVTEVMATV